MLFVFSHGGFCFGPRHGEGVGFALSDPFEKNQMSVTPGRLSVWVTRILTLIDAFSEAT